MSLFSSNEKAEIVILGSPQKKITCQFNPETLSVTKTAKWPERQGKKRNVPAQEFAGGGAASMKVSLLFDSTHNGNDVRTMGINDLLKLVRINTQEQQPPRCYFAWGKLKFFEAVATDINVSFTMFLGDGTPVRARVELGLKEYEDKGVFQPQNPTSRSEARRTWVVLEGQTLDWIAYQEYGNPGAWRHIADTNNLDDPKDLRAGQVLSLVPLQS